MSRPTITPTGHEVTFDNDEIIVSKTDLKGIITYANEVFLRVAGYAEEDVLGQPHNLIRHPDMPRCVFQILWDTLQSGSEIFAYVINMTKNGDHYWVFAHVTPTFDDTGDITGYHSNRRVPDPGALSQVKALYATLLEEEQKHASKRDGLQASLDAVVNLLSEKEIEYDEFVWSLAGGSNG